MKKLFAALAFSALIVSPCLADDAAPKIDSHLAAALDVLEASNAQQNVLAMVDALTPIMLGQVKKQHPDANEKVIVAFQGAFHDEMVASTGELMKMQAAIYAEHFSEADLKALAAFYRSEAGKRFVAEQPAMMKEITPVASAWGMQTAQRAIQRATEKLQKEGLKL
ncbi:MAG: DUF2059 domain-containing protein [Rhizomicrobium sp.]|nr:DUF2059 domain-containing protein [Rhizomicrobium sp.]